MDAYILYMKQSELLTNYRVIRRSEGYDDVEWNVPQAWYPCNRWNTIHRGRSEGTVVIDTYIIKSASFPDSFNADEEITINTDKGVIYITVAEFIGALADMGRIRGIRRGSKVCLVSDDFGTIFRLD